jgi:hypothetical protein
MRRKESLINKALGYSVENPQRKTNAGRGTSGVLRERDVNSPLNPRNNNSNGSDKPHFPSQRLSATKKKTIDILEEIEAVPSKSAEASSRTKTKVPAGTNLKLSRSVSFSSQSESRTFRLSAPVS